MKCRTLGAIGMFVGIRVGACGERNKHALIDGGWDRVPVGTSWWSITGFLLTLLAGFFALGANLWWCGRQYYRARGKGYQPVPVGTVAFGGGMAAIFAVIYGDMLVVDSTWSDAAKWAIVLLTLPLPALVVTVLVALLPRRLRRSGPRSSSFLRSPACRVLEGVLAVAAIATGIGGIVGLWLVGIEALRLWQIVPGLWGTQALLRFARGRLDAPTLSATVTADDRPAVLYLRAFRQESDPFAWVPTKELSRYTRRPANTVAPAATFEQYLGAEFAKQLGPFVALGNPLDPLPPEGAARSYAPDDDWQQHFSTLAATAAAIVMDGSRSDNLHWELNEILRNGWQTRLFFLTAPAPRVRAPVSRLAYALMRSAKGVRTPRWEQFAAELEPIGLHVPPTAPGPGSVVAFDAAGCAEVVVRGAQQPEEFVATVQTRLARENKDQPRTLQ